VHSLAPAHNAMRPASSEHSPAGCAALREKNHHAVCRGAIDFATRDPHLHGASTKRDKIRMHLPLHDSDQVCGA
ncbi:MAG: hypothetical protein WCF88_00720, partial [Candidatus Acidiferrales bacterium]